MFYASLERFVRKHHGRVGWSVFRSGMIVGAAMRGALLRDAAAPRPGVGSPCSSPAQCVPRIVLLGDDLFVDLECAFRDPL
ncbi:hypothetical protein, partial [Enterococcus faecium]|uniref:hypothetical protein n=1 Tax=Enterococcus faecium TaxID=1352 RepID=UPI0034E93D9A